MLMDGDVRGDDLRREPQGKEISNVTSLVHENVDVMQGWKFSLDSETLWWVVWGAMALLGSVNAMEPYWTLSGRRGIELGVLLLGIATVQLARGVSFLPRNDLVLAKVVLVLFGVGLLGQRLHMYPPRNDFKPYYVAGHLAAEHLPGALYYPATFPDGRTDPLGAGSGWQEVVRRYGVPGAVTFVYPPFFAALLTPLAHFSPGVAYQGWNVLTVFLTLVSVWIILRLGGRQPSVVLWMILTVGLFSWAPFFHELAVGQVSSLLLFLWALGVWLLSRGQEWPSAFCIALATMIKITPVIAVPLLALHRKWKWLTAYGCWMVGMIGFSIWRMGWAAHEQFLHNVIPTLSCGVVTYGNISIVAFVQELFLGHMPMHGLPSSLPPGACLVSKATSAALLALLMLQFYRYRKESNLTLHLVLLLLFSLVTSPIAWTHHYVMALLPLLYLWCREREPDRDNLLLATVLAVGTSVTAFPLPLIVHNHATQLLIAGIVPCLTIALVYSRVSGERLEGIFQGV
jgi:Glycosyltransferase family 87